MVVRLYVIRYTSLVDPPTAILFASRKTYGASDFQAVVRKFYN
jgi:hypothetical protein